MFLASFPAGPWQANCYLAAVDAGRECVVVDPGVDAFDSVRITVDRISLHYDYQTRPERATDAPQAVPDAALGRC